MRHCTLEIAEADQAQLREVIHHGHAKARIQTRARILLRTAEGWSMERIAAALDVSVATITNTRTRYRAGGIERVLHDQVQARRRCALDAEQEAILVAVACSPVPDHHGHWTIRLLRDKLIELHVVEGISASTIQAYVKKMSSNPGSGNPGACPNGTLPTLRR
jgi:hypothetical protein